MTRFSPGDWYGVVTPAGVALLPRDVPIGTLERVWIDLRAGGGLGALIEGLVGAFGTSLTRLPEFGVIALSADGEVRVAMRGQVSARLWMLGEDEPTLVNGAGVTTWNERLWSGVGRAELMVAEPGGELLPVVDGIALASLINVAILDFDTQPPVEVASAPPAQIPVPPIKMPLAEPDSQPASPSEPEREPVPELQSDQQPEPKTDSQVEAQVEQDATDVPHSESSDEPELESSDAPVDEPPSGQTTVMEPQLSDEPEQEVPAQSDYDRILFGETVAASAEAAAVRVAETDTPAAPAEMVITVPPVEMPRDLPPVPPRPAGLIAGIPSFGAPPPPPPPTASANASVPAPWADHDGETIMVDDLRGALAAHDAPVVSPGSPASPLPPPRMLLAGHPAVVLDRSVIVGSRPRVTRVQGDSVPQLVTVQGPNGEISRSHVEIRVEHAAVLAVDLNSTNGTVLLRDGADPLRLHPSETYMLVPGDRIDLGDGVMLAFEGLR